ncbi:MAG: GNAT family N-acetyltransferase [Anaerolineae bacterium]|nr:GNAT family N-acetyltransferase [Anaerolineae bacterium]
MGFLDAADRPSPLASHLEHQMRDLNWTLAHYTFVANVTALAAECDIAHSPAMSVASCRALPRLGLAFVGTSADLLATYATFLADSGSEVSLLVSEEQRPVVQSAFEVAEIVPKVQMLYRGDPSNLDPGAATELVENDFAAAQALARAEQMELQLFSDEPFDQGPAFGVWDRRKLVAMGTTTLAMPGLVQIGNVVTREAYRRQGCATAVVSALLLRHLALGASVFVIVDKTDAAALGLFERVGFAVERTMYSMQCVLR